MVVGIIIGLFVVSLGAVFVTARIVWVRQRFATIFGFRPSHKNSQAPVKSEQAKVTQVLAEFALRFEEACTNQDRVRQELAELRPENGFWYREQKSLKADLKYAGKRVNLHKQAFWQHHAIAKRRGFTVKAGHRMYLSPQGVTNR